MPVFPGDRICAVVARRRAADLLAGLRSAAREATTIELRLDWLANRREIDRAITGLRAFLKPPRAKSRKQPAPTLIATLRRKQAGGEFTGTVADQLEVLLAAISSGCQWCDFEIESAKKNPDAVRRLQVRGANVLLSFHDFQRTPSDLTSILKQMHRLRADAFKLATHCDTLGDSLRLLDLARGRDDLVIVPMGEVGLPARVLALSRRSALCYASSGEPTAPGQLTVAEMRELYRAHTINARTRIFGIIGDPLRHSLSPLMHNSGYASRGLNAVFLPFQVNDLRDFMRSAPRFNIAGLSVTKPHKQTILPYLARTDSLAARIGAINTVVRRGDRLLGYNTDYVGVLRALQARMRLRGSRILILGAGGAARAAAFALVHAGASVFVTARRAAQANELAQAAGCLSIPRAAIKHEKFDAILNATPVGMAVHGGSPLRADELNCRVIMDMVYRPMWTELLRIATRRGLKTISGVEMFIAQGAAQWELWFGNRAPEKIMRRVVLDALRRDEYAIARHSSTKPGARK
jgi:3-dehydroquinate dehydratase/shikimate dehydrogenase